MRRSLRTIRQRVERLAATLEARDGGDNLRTAIARERQGLHALASLPPAQRAAQAAEYEAKQHQKERDRFERLRRQPPTTLRDRLLAGCLRTNPQIALGALDEAFRLMPTFDGWVTARSESPGDVDAAAWAQVQRALDAGGYPPAATTEA